MSSQSEFVNLLSGYHAIKSAGGGSKAQSSQGKRKKAVVAALTVLNSNASAGGFHPSVYKDEIGPLADAIQKALEEDR